MTIRWYPAGACQRTPGTADRFPAHLRRDHRHQLHPQRRRCRPLLSACLGHSDPASTYWYLEADPELLGLAAGRLQPNQENVHERPGTAYPELFHPQALARSRRRPNTIACYRDTIRLLVSCVCQQTGKQPARQSLADLGTAMISAFLDHLETSRGNSITTRNTRLAVIPPRPVPGRAATNARSH
jgi:hypothetical protein